MTRFDEILHRLLDARVDFVVVGGVAAVAQGYDGSTFDFDICARFSPDNLDRIVAALQDVRLRFAPPTERPVTERGGELATYRYLAWSTAIGRIDVIRDVPPIGEYEAVASGAESVELFGRTCLILSLDGLIAVKEHVARDKDLRMLPSLRALKALRGG